MLLILSVMPIAASSGFMFIPLFRDFDYEFGEMLGIITFVTAILMTLAVKRQLSKNNVADDQFVIEIPNSNLYIFQISLCIILLSLIGSLLIILAYSLLCGCCPLLRGLQFFLLLPVTSAIIGCSLGFFIGALLSNYAWLTTISVLIISLALNIFWLKLNVPIYIYSVFWGYFPGPIYDEWIPVTTTLWIHRFWSLCIAALFVISALMWKRRPFISKKLIFVFLFLLIVIFCIYEARFSIGFDTRYEELKGELGGNIRSKNVTITFDQSLNRTEIDWIQTLADYYYIEICDYLDIKPGRMIMIYVYKDEYQKKQLMGAGRTNFAKTVNDEIHINYDDLAGTLKHEMTHVLANDFANKIYSTQRIGLLEGLAVASEWSENYFTPHEWSAALKNQNKLPDVIPLVEGGSFFATAPGMSYVVSGSFTRFLIDTYGIKTFKRVYHKEDIKNVYGTTTAVLAERWLKFLDSISVRPEDIQLAGLLIQPALFQKRCPHYVADILEEANHAIGNQDYLTASDLYRKALITDVENYRIRIGQIKSQYYSGQWRQTLQSLNTMLADERPNYISRAALQLLKGDILMRMNKTDSAAVEYRRIEESYKNVHIIYVSSKLRMDFLDKGLNEPLKSLLSAPNPDDQIILLKEINQRFPDNESVKFWLSRLFFQQSGFADVIKISGPEKTMADSLLEFERLNMSAESYMRLSKYDLARNFYKQAKRFAFRVMDREIIDQRLSLLTWLEHRSN